jgi:hypothetical protein
MRIEMAQYILPFLAAVIGISVSVTHARPHWKAIVRGDPGPLLLILVTLLCIAYGVERLTYSEQFATRLDRIDQDLRLHENATFTDDTHTIWLGIEELMTGMKHDIRTVQSSDRPNKIPEEFNGLRDRVADRMVEMKKQHGDVMYQIVLVFDGKKNPKQLAEIKQKNCAGLKFYRDKGLEDNVKLSVYDHETLTKFDVLIIDENHVNIGLTHPKAPVRATS